MNDDDEARAFIREHRMTTPTAYDDLTRLLSRARSEARTSAHPYREPALPPVAPSIDLVRVDGVDIDARLAALSPLPTGTPEDQRKWLNALHHKLTEMEGERDAWKKRANDADVNTQHLVDQMGRLAVRLDRLADRFAARLKRLRCAVEAARGWFVGHHEDDMAQDMTKALDETK